MIPRIIHQSWKTAEIPHRWQAWQKSWKQLHPHYEYRYWTDDDNRDFIGRRFSSFLPLYDGYALDIMRADLARYLVLFHHGGLYVDLDFEALRPVGGLLGDAKLVLGLEPDSHAARPLVAARGISRIICNAFMGSVPGHPFWNHVLNQLTVARHQRNVLDATGPFMLTRAYDCYDGADIVLVSAKQIYPLDNEEVRKLDPAQQKLKLKEAYAVHHWSGSWWRQSLFANVRDAISRRRQVAGD